MKCSQGDIQAAIAQTDEVTPFGEVVKKNVPTSEAIPEDIETTEESPSFIQSTKPAYTETSGTNRKEPLQASFNVEIKKSSATAIKIETKCTGRLSLDVTIYIPEFLAKEISE